MSRKTLTLIVALVIAPVIVYFVWPSDEARIRKLIREGARAVEEEKIEEVMAPVSFNYADDRGATYLLIKEAMTRFFRNMDNIKVEYEIARIAITKQTAEAELDLRVVASSGADTGYIMGDISRPLHMKFVLEKERASWLIVKATGLPRYY